ncbi:MAG: tail fiber domain-containing protein [Bacteroidia bacterium]|nr:tail fiber domain-containing protein [Bacteroidia bacterium]
MGYFSTASGGSSTAMGVLTIASGGSSTAMGYYTTAQPYASLAIGRYNIISGTYNSWVATDPLFIIGNGSGDAARSNAMTVLKNGNVGIGTTTPNCLLHVNAASGDIFRLQDNGTTRMKMIDNGKIMIGGNSTPSNTIDVDGNMSIGSYYGSSAPSNGLIVSGNVGIGTASPSSKFVVANGESNFYSGTYSDPAVGFVYDAKFGGSNNGIAVRGQSYFAGKVGIGTSSPANKLDVNGLIRAQGADWPATGAGVEIAYNGTGYIQSFDRGASSWKELRLGGNVTPVNDNLFSCGTSAYKWTAVWAVDGTINTSDLRLKKDIQKLDYGLSEVLKLEPVSFYWKQNDRGRKIGLIAQEVQNVIAEVVVVGEDPQKTLGLNYAELVPVLIKAIQEISAEMEETKTENKKEIEQLKTKIETLNALLQSSAKTK